MVVDSGLAIDSKRNFCKHIDKIIKQVYSGIFMLRRQSDFYGRDFILNACYGFIILFIIL